MSGREKSDPRKTLERENRPEEREITAREKGTDWVVGVTHVLEPRTTSAGWKAIDWKSWLVTPMQSRRHGVVLCRSAVSRPGAGRALPSGLGTVVERLAPRHTSPL